MNRVSGAMTCRSPCRCCWRAKKRRGRHGSSDGWRPRRWRPTPIRARKRGLAAVKHQQQQAERTEQQGRAFVALAHVVADAGGGGWPEHMPRDLQACRTPQERNAWAEKWGTGGIQPS